MLSPKLGGVAIATDRRQKETDKARARQLAIKAAPTNEAFYKRLLRRREIWLSRLEEFDYTGQALNVEDKDIRKKLKITREMYNQAAHDVLQYESTHDLLKKPDQRAADGDTIGYEIPLLVPVSSDSEEAN